MRKFIPCGRGLNVKLKILKNSRIKKNIFSRIGGGGAMEIPLDAIKRPP